MKSLLYDDLRALARRILEAPEGEMSDLQHDARILYERLTVLRYTEGLVEELKHSMAEDTVSEKEAQDFSYAVEGSEDLSPDVFPGQDENDALQQAPVEQDLPLTCTESPVMEEEPDVREEEFSASVPEEPQEAYAESITEDRESPHTIVDAISPLSGQREEEQKRIPADIQQSLFGDDLFTKELDFDPDEDLFEERAGASVKVEITESVVVEQTIPDIDTPSADRQEEEKGYAGGNVSSAFFSFQVVNEEEEKEKEAESALLTDEEPFVPAPDDQTDLSVEQPEESVQADEETVILDSKEGENGRSKVDVEDHKFDYQYVPLEVGESQPATINETVGQSAQPKPSLNEILSVSEVNMELNDRIAFVEHLFDGDNEAFEASVKYIFSLTDIDVANEFIIEILKPSYNNWFEKEKYERRFSQIVLAHFMNKH